MYGQTSRAYQMLVDAYQIVLGRMHLKNLVLPVAMIAALCAALAPVAKAAEVYPDESVSSGDMGVQTMIVTHYHNQGTPDMYSLPGSGGFATRYDQFVASSLLMRQFLAAQSGGQLDLNITLVPTGIAITTKADGTKWVANDTLGDNAVAKAFAPEIQETFDRYRHRMSLLMDVLGTSSMASPYPTAGVSNGTSLWSNDFDNVAYHEFGHNLGFGHANSLDGATKSYTATFNPDGTVSYALSTAPRVRRANDALVSAPIGTQVSTYGGFYSVMGQMGGIGTAAAFSPFEKQKAGWLHASQLPQLGTMIQAGTTQTVKVYDANALTVVSKGSGDTLRYGVEQGFQEVPYALRLSRLGEAFDAATGKWKPVKQELALYYTQHTNSTQGKDVVVCLDQAYLGTLQLTQGVVDERDLSSLIFNSGSDYLSIAHEDPRDPARFRPTHYRIDYTGTGTDAAGQYATLQIESVANDLKLMGSQWDAAGAAGAQDGAGIWTTGTGRWRNIAAATDNHNWAANGDAVVGAGGSIGAGTVLALGGNVSATSLTFASLASGNYKVTGGAGDSTLTLGTWGVMAAESAELACKVAFGADQYWTVTDGKTLALSGAVTGNGKSLSKFGQGVLSLQMTNTWGSKALDVAEGTVRQEVTQVFDAASASDPDRVLNIDQGATYQVVGGTLNLNKSTDFFPTPLVRGDGTLQLSRTDGSHASQEVVFFAAGGGGQSSCALDVDMLLDKGLHHIGSNGNGGWNAYDSSSGGYASGPATLSGDIRGEGGIAFYGVARSQLVLSGDNTFTGEIVLERGALHVVGAGALQGRNQLTFSVASGDAASFYLRGTDRTIGDLSSSGLGAARIANSTGATSFIASRATPGAATLTVVQGTAGVFGGTIQDTLDDPLSGGNSSGNAGSLSLTKQGAAALTLTGANTYTGTTTVNAGKLILDYAAGSERLYNGATSGRNLVLTGGEVVFENLGVTKTQTFDTTTLLSGNTNKLTLGSGWAVGGAVNFGTFDVTAGAVDFSDIGITPGWAKASGNAGQSTFFLGSVTANGGVNAVATDASGYLILGNVTDYSQGGQIVSSSGAAIRLIETGSGGNVPSAPVALAASGTTDVGSILNAYTTHNPTDTVTLDIGSGNVLRLGQNGAVTSAAGTKLALTNGALTAGGATEGSAGTLNFNATNDILVSSQVIDNGIGGRVSLAKVGVGTLTLSNASNNHTGTTTVNQGTLRASVSGALGATSAVVLANAAGAILDLSDTQQTIGALAGGGTLGGTVNLGSSGVLTTGGAGTNTVYAGSIIGTGTGSLVKTGSGTQTLSGVSTYAGATAVKAGTLRLAGGDNRLNAATTLSLGDAAAPTSGKLVLGSTGVSGVADGKSDLTVAGLAAAGAGDAVVGGNAAVSTLTVNLASGSGTFAGTLGGAGANENQLALTKDGDSVLILSGASTFAGATTVKAGVLQAGSTQAFSASSAAVVAAGATLDLANQSNSIGSLAGAGDVLLGGATLTTGGNGAAADFSGAITGTGGLAKTGSGTQTLSGSANNFSSLAVNVGTLRVASTGGLVLSSGGTVVQNAFFEHNGTFDGSLTVNGTLTGNGGQFTTGMVTIASGGILSPGGNGAAGTLAFHGLTIESGGIYHVDLLSASSYDKIVVNDEADLIGQFLQIAPGSGWTAAAGQSYTVVSGSQVVGQLSQLLPVLAPGLGWEVVNDGTGYHLNVVNNGQNPGALSGAGTAQQAEGIRALNAVVLSDPQLQAAFRVAAGAGDRQAQLAVVDTLMGSAQVAAAHGAAWAGQQRTRENLLHLDRLSAPTLWDGGLVDSGERADASRMAALSDIPESGASGDARSSVFGNVNYLKLDKGQSDAGAASMKATSEGVTAGVDTRVGESVILGGAFAYDHVRATAGGGQGTADSDTFTLAAYARYRFDRHWFADGSLGVGYVKSETERRGLPGGLTAKGSTSGFQWTTAAKVGYLSLFDDWAWEVTPYGQVQAVGTRMDGYAETGAGGAGLSYGSSSDTTWLSTVGVEAARTWALGNGWAIRPGVGLGWTHRLNDGETSVQTSFVGDPSVAFKTYGQAFDKDSVQGSLRVDVKAPSGLTFFVEGQLSKGLDDTRSRQFSANGGVRYDF